MTRVKNRYPRIPCVVPFCGCGSTRYPPEPGMQIICTKHWRLVAPELKARRRRLKAMLRRRGELNTDRGRRLDSKVWARMVGQAITRAAGAPI